MIQLHGAVEIGTTQFFKNTDSAERLQPVSRGASRDKTSRAQRVMDDLEAIRKKEAET